MEEIKILRMVILRVSRRLADPEDLVLEEQFRTRWELQLKTLMEVLQVSLIRHWLPTFHRMVQRKAHQELQV